MRPSLKAPVLILHGDADMAVPWMEGKAISSWSRRGTFVLIEGADHVFGMSHAEMATHWPRHLVQAWNAQREWIHTQVAESIDSLEFLTTKKVGQLADSTFE